MTRPRLRFTTLLVVLLIGFGPSAIRFAHAQAPAPAPDAKPSAERTTPGQFIPVVEPITDSSVSSLRDGLLPYLSDMADAPAPPDGPKPDPVLIFEFRPGDDAPGRTSFGGANELAKFLSREINSSEKKKARTVAFVPEPLKGYAVLAVLACDEIVMGSSATLGPITPDGDTVDDVARASIRSLAERHRREPELALFLGMLDKNENVMRVKTGDGQVSYVLSTDFDEFKKTHAVTEEAPVWEAGNRGVLTAEMARGGLVRLLADDRGKVKEAYGLASTADRLSGGDATSALLKIDGPIDGGVEEFFRRRLSEEARKGTARIFIQISSEGGEGHATDLIVDALLGLKGIETIAFVEDRAMGMSALVPLACDQIVFKKGAQMGAVSKVVVGRNRQDDVNVRAVSDRAAEIASRKGHPPALARAMVDPSAVVVQARDNDKAAVVSILESEVVPGRHVVQDTIKPAGEVLTLTADSARTLGMANRVVEDDRELFRSFGLKGRPRAEGATWVDNLVKTLNSSWMSGLLLFIGLFMLILELKLPGVGLPAIISALAFLIFFWSHYLGGTADKLEILLFLVGVVCLALELFVFPGFAVFGLSGILLILGSVIMASHTFVWPTQEYEYRQMGNTLMQVTGSILMVTVGAIVIGRYFPSLPLFRRMVLVPPDPYEGADEPGVKPSLSDGTYFYLLGEVGRTTTALKPTGKARFGEALVDVIADGFYIAPDSAVEVVEVRGARVIVKKA